MEKKYIVHVHNGACVTKTDFYKREYSFNEFDRILADPIETEETIEEYEAMDEDGRMNAKDRGGYIAGALRNNNRSKKDLYSRNMLTIDIDEGLTDFSQVKAIEEKIDSQYIVHSTRNSKANSPHIRIVIPLSRPVIAKEYNFISKTVCDQLGVTVDEQASINNPVQIMLFPTVSKGNKSSFYHSSQIDGRTPLEVDPIVANMPKEEVKPKAKEPKEPKVIDQDNKLFVGELNSFEYKNYIHLKSEELVDAFMDSGLLTRAKKYGFVCNECENGSGRHGTGVVLDEDDVDRYHYKCFKCGKHEDLINYIDYPEEAKMQGLYGKISYIRETLIEKYGKDMIVPISQAEYKYIEQPIKEEIARPLDTIPDMVDALNGNIHLIDEFLLEAKANLDTNVIEFLKIDPEDLGSVDDSNQIPGSNDYFDKPYLVIPTSSAGCVFVDPNSFKEFPLATMENSVNTPAGLLLGRNKSTEDHPQQAIILTDRTIDMLAFYKAGAPCVISVANNSIEEVASLLQALDNDKPLVLAYQNDKEARTKQKSDCNYLKSQGFSVRIIDKNLNDLYLGTQSALGALKRDEERFIEKVKVAYTTFEREFEEGYAANHIDGFLKRLEARKSMPYLKTGFYRKLDSPTMLDGGLFGDNVYFLGGLTGLGKSTLAIQIADYLACNGTDVIYYALEMSEDEIIARCASRRSWLKNPDYALTEREILDSRRHSGFSAEKYQNMQISINDFALTAGKHLRIVESVGDISAEDIKRDIKEFKAFKPKAPLVIFVDYLQLMTQPKDIKFSMTDKQIVDRNTKTLKQTARDFNIPIVVLSSFNRQSYNNDLQLSDYKDSGSIEYTGSVIMSIAMYYRKKAITGSTKAEKEEQKQENERIESDKEYEKNFGYRTILLKILKNRQGRSDEETYFAYKAPYNCFVEVDYPTIDKTNDIKIQSYMDPDKELDGACDKHFEIHDYTNKATFTQENHTTSDLLAIAGELVKLGDYNDAIKNILESYGAKTVNTIKDQDIESAYNDIKALIEKHQIVHTVDDILQLVSNYTNNVDFQDALKRILDAYGVKSINTLKDQDIESAYNDIKELVNEADRQIIVESAI